MALEAPLVPSVSIGVEPANMDTSNDPETSVPGREAKTTPTTWTISARKRRARRTPTTSMTTAAEAARVGRAPSRQRVAVLRNKQLSKAKKKREAPFLNRLYVKPRTARKSPGDDGGPQGTVPKSTRSTAKTSVARSSSITSATLS